MSTGKLNEIADAGPLVHTMDWKEIGKACADAGLRIAELEAALRSVLIGGNHVALLIGPDHPPTGTSHDVARLHYGSSRDGYEAWCCWNAIMRARDVLEAKR